MKLNNYKFIFLGVAMALTSCLNDLNVEPIDDNLVTADDIYVTVDDYKSGLAKLYACFALTGQQGPAGDGDISGIDEGTSNYLRQYWNCQELTTDEAVVAWDDETIKDFHYQTWTAADGFITGLYARIIYTVSICNEYIRLTDGNSDEDIARFNAEAKFIRALAYYHALDLFGNPSFITEEDEPSSTAPERITREELFVYIENQLTDLEDKLGEPRFEYARADKATLWMLQAKLYLNAKVYIGQTKYTEALTALNKVLLAGYEISDDYRHNFVADNHNSTEMIFPITHDGVNTTSYGGTNYIIHAAIGGSMTDVVNSMFGVSNAWSGLRTTPEFVSLFPDTEGEIDSRALFWTDGQSLDIEDIGVFTDGYAITKFRNRNLDGTEAEHSGNDYVDTDYPMFRLADAYLMYAEAVLREGSGGSISQAVNLVNELRERAYGDMSGNITSTDLTLDFILDERGRELYWEGHRRTDLIRFEKFTDGDYVWQWKGNVKDGVATESYRDLLPIPSDDLSSNPNLKQNPGY